MNANLYAIVSVIAVSLVSLVGALTLLMEEKKLRRILFLLVALSVGALFGDAIIHLLPEIFATSSVPAVSSLYIIAGMLVFFILEKFLHWKHSHEVEDEHSESQIKPLGYLSLVADGLHNFIDGIIIGVSYLAGWQIGLASTIAVALHEIPQEAGDFGLLLHAGFSKRKALFFNFLSALVALVGTIVALAIGSWAGNFIFVALPIAAGGFIYIAGSDLVPELHKITDPRKSAVQFLAILVGVALMMLLLLIE